LCFTVEIDEKQFPDATYFISQLSNYKIPYMSNSLSENSSKKQCICYRFESDPASLYYVSNILADIIKHNYLHDYAENIIETNYIGIDRGDRENIISSVLKFTDVDEMTDLLKDFISSNKHIHLGGFVLFRMKNFLHSFEDEIDFSIDEYIEQQRYRDFVKFLNFFVSIQEPSFDEINLILSGNSRYSLLDSKGVPLNKNLLDSTHCEISTLENSNSYLIINDLVTLAPKHITIHSKVNSECEEITTMIKEIFKNRVTVCYDCNLCSKWHKNNIN